MSTRSAILQDYVQSRRRMALVYLASVTAVSSMLFFYVWQFVKVVEVEKAILATRRENSRLKERLDMLQAERAYLGRLSRIEETALTKLGLRPPDRSQVWYIPVRSAKRVDGR